MAKAVHFLHTGVIPGVYNNQLKTNNILLDEHRIAKLSDYGMSIIIEENEKLEVYMFPSYLYLNLLLAKDMIMVMCGYSETFYCSSGKGRRLKV